MAAALPAPFDCCNDTACKTTNIVVVQSINLPLAVETLADLRAIPAPQRYNLAVVTVWSEVGVPGTGWIAVWRASDQTQDAPPDSTLPNDLVESDFGRWRQYL